MSTGSRQEAAEVAAYCAALSVPNFAQGVYGDRVGCRIVEERLLQAMAMRLCHEAPQVPERKEEDEASELNLLRVVGDTTKAAGNAAGGLVKEAGGLAKGTFGAASSVAGTVLQKINPKNLMPRKDSDAEVFDGEANKAMGK